MTAWLFPKYDVDTKEMLNEEVQLNKIGDYGAVGPDGKAYNIPMFDESALTYLADFARDTIDYGLQCPFLVTGLPGRGKSTFSARLLNLLRPNFELDRVHFYMDDLLERIQKDPIADPDNTGYMVQLFDEAIEGTFNQSWQSQVTNIKVLNIVRIKRQIIGYAIPNLSDFNPKLHPLLQFWVFLYRKGIAELRLPFPSQFDGSVYWKPIMAIQFGAEQGEWWDRYEDKKIRFIDDYTGAVNEGEIGSKKLLAIRDQRDDLIDHVVDSGLMTVKDVARVCRVKQNTVSMWRSRRTERQAKVSIAV